MRKRIRRSLLLLCTLLICSEETLAFLLSPSRRAWAIPPKRVRVTSNAASSDGNANVNNKKQNATDAGNINGVRDYRSGMSFIPRSDKGSVDVSPSSPRQKIGRIDWYSRNGRPRTKFASRFLILFCLDMILAVSLIDYGCCHEVWRKFFGGRRAHRQCGSSH